MSEIKLPAASGGGSISIKGPASSSSDVDLLDTSGNLKLSDSDELRLGTGDDLKLYHDGSNTYIDNTTGDLKIRGDNIRFRSKSVDEMQISTYVNGAVQIAYDGAIKFETKSTGIGITSGQRECNLTLQNDALTWKIVNYDYGNNGTDHLGFHDGTSDRLIIHDTGEGISFNGDTASANALGDYEEGTWTPDLGNFTALSFNSRSGRYTKIGRFVCASGYMNIASRTGGGGHMKLTGLPFTCVDENARGGGTVTYASGLTSDTYDLPTITVDNNQTQASFYKGSGATFASQDMNMSTGSIYITLWYEAA